MKKRCRFFGALAIGLALASAPAEPSKDAPPSIPVLPRAPAFASWTITFQYPETPPDQAPAVKPADRIRSVEITKTGGNFRQITRRESGKADERWIFEGEQMRTAPDLDVVVMIPPPSEEYASPDFRDTAKTDFEGLDWVSLETYKGLKEFDGRKGFLFETIRGGKTLTVLLARETQYPLSYSDGHEIRRFVFHPPPTAPLVLPERFVDALRQQKKGREMLKRIPSPP